MLCVKKKKIVDNKIKKGMWFTLDAAWRNVTNPESKLMPRSINDVTLLTQTSNDLQWSLCHVQSRQTLAVEARPV